MILIGSFPTILTLIGLSVDELRAMEPTRTGRERRPKSGKFGFVW